MPKNGSTKNTKDTKKKHHFPLVFVAPFPAFPFIPVGLFRPTFPAPPE